MILKIIFSLSLCLNVFFLGESYLPKDWKFNIHNSEKFFTFLTNNSIYQFFFPAPEIPQHKDFVLAVYQSMKDIHEILSYYKISYYSDGGTTLGVMRHKGLIPWDNDIDICLMSEYELRFQSIIPVFKQMGYTVNEVSFGYKILTTQYYDVMVKGKKTRMRVCCDVFLVTKHNDDIFYLKGTARSQWPRAFHKESDLFPLKKRFFGSVMINTPNNPIPYLDRHYGKDWSKVGYDATHHEEVSLKGFALKKFDPAQPLGPLKDRVNLG